MELRERFVGKMEFSFEFDLILIVRLFCYINYKK